MRQLISVPTTCSQTSLTTARSSPALLRRLFSVALVCFIWCLLVTPASAQNMKYTQNSVDLGKRSDFTIDPTTLGLGFTLTLGNYPGRAGSALPITLAYSSKLWRMDALDTYGAPYSTLTKTRTEAKYAEYSASGWTTNMDVPRLEGLDWLPYDYTGAGMCTLTNCVGYDPGATIFYVSRMMVHLPDGSAHELRKSDTPDTGHTAGGVYYAVDGSQMRYDASADVLYLGDGSRYLNPYYGTNGVKYIDRNGNTLSYNSTAKQWTDTLGKVVSRPRVDSTQTGDYDYLVKGVGGVNMTYTLRWKNLADVRTNMTQALRYSGDRTMELPLEPLLSPSLFSSTTFEVACTATGQVFNPVVLYQIVLPHDAADTTPPTYTFTYNVWGEIDKVVYPTGGYERYRYEEIPGISASLQDDDIYRQTNRGVVERWVSPSGSGTDEAHWVYSAGGTGSPPGYTVTITAPDGSRTERVLSTQTNGDVRFGFEHVLTGKPIEERAFAAPSTQYPTGQLLRRTLTEWTNSGPLPGGEWSATRDARAIKQVNILLDTGGQALYSVTTFDHDADLNVKSIKRYGYVAVAQATAESGDPSSFTQLGTLLRTEETTYLVNDTSIAQATRDAYRARNLLSLPTSTRVKNAAGTIIAQSTISYDEAAYPLLTYASVTSWTDPQTTVRGNATTQSTWLSTTNTWLSAHAQYDQCGSPRKAWDARGNVSEVIYSSTYKYAYPTSTISPDPDGAGALTSLTSSSTYDLTSGAVLSQTDANGQVITMEYALTDYRGNDNLLQRLTKVNLPDGGWTAYAYGDQVDDLYVETRTALDTTRYTEARQEFDGLGRASRSYALESGTTYMVSDVQYDQMGRVWRASNPYRMQGLNGAVNPSGKWTTTSYDDLGRVKTVTLPDQTIVQTSYQGIYTTVTDQAGKQRRQKVDALGRVVRVDEPDASGSLGTVDAPAQASIYDYDTLGNLVHIQQGTGTQLQHRYFKYDSLSRLIFERQVEQTAIFTATDSLTGNSQWTRKLLYDQAGANGENNTGMLTSHYDARNIHTQYAYDGLGRITEVSYSDGTPTVTNIYDRARAGYFNRGRLSEVQTEAVAAQGQMPAIPATTQSYDYDLMGRVKSQQQTVGGQSYTLAYGYNLGGQLTSQTYPSGRVVNYSYDDAARLAGVTSGATTYASNFVYGTKGALTSVALGNGAVQNFSYNDRLQLTSMSLIKGSTTLQRYEYQYGRVDANTGTVDATKNNGQIARIEGYIGTLKQWQQRFSYDSLGRLSQAGEYRGDNNQQSYLTNYDYDTFGNRYQSQANNQNALGYTAIEDTHVSKSTNRFTFSQITYDAAGNITVDAKFRGNQYQYDANNRQKWTALTDGTAPATSVYDGAGQRVATIANGTTSYMVYDAGGKLVAEYGQAASSTSGTQYIFADHQGSTRLVTNQTGGVIARHDYQAFGEEIASGVGQRTTAQGYDQADSVRQKYAGMEKDEVTGMSHTLWRKYDSSSGRWTSPDPYTASMTIANPQTFNRYTYVSNDPVNLTDASGLSPDRYSAEYGSESDDERGKSGAEAAYEQRLQDRRDQIAAGRQQRRSNTNQFAAPSARRLVGRHAGSTSGSQSSNINQFGGLIIRSYNHSVDAYSLRSRIADIVSYAPCSNFIRDLIIMTATDKNPAEFTNVLDAFDIILSQNGFIYGFTILRAYGFDGSTVHGTISSGNAQVEFAHPYFNVRTPAIIDEQFRIQAFDGVHEIMHLAGRNIYDDFAYANAVADMQGVERPNFRGLPNDKAVRKASDYWNRALYAACSQRR